jgi:hypothetical protein
MDGAERRYLRIGILQIAGIAVAGLYLGGAGGRAKGHHMVDAAALGPHEQIFRRSLASAGKAIMLVQALFGLLDYAGMENMGMDIDEHKDTGKGKV